MKKIVGILMVLIMVVGLAACSGSSDSNSSNDKGTGDTSKGTSSDSGNESSDSNESKIDTSDHVVIRYMITGNKPNNDQNDKLFEKLNAILTEKVNAELEIYWIEWTDYLTNYNLTLASNDGTVDLVGTATDWLDAWPNVKKGAFLSLSEDMLKTYAPMTYEQVSDDHWDMCRYDGDIYLIPEDHFSQWINHGFIYRSDWAEEMGIENGLHSWEDVGNYFAAIKEQKPDIIPWDVAGSTGGASTLAGGWVASHSDDIFIEGLDVPIFFATKDDYYTIKAPYMTDDSFLDFASMMKDWSDAGYWREDCLNYSGDTREEFLDGETGVDQHHTETWYGDDYVKMQERQPGGGVGFFYFGEETQNVTKMSITHGATAISAGSKNPERALMVYDLIRNDEECYRLFNYGIEGVQYVLTDDGKMARPEGYDSDRDQIQTNFWWGRNDDLQLIDSLRDYDAYKALTDEYNTFAIDYPYGQLVFDTDSISSYLANMSNVYSTYMPLIAFGKTDDPKATVEAFRNDMKAAGYDEVLAELQRQMDEFKASVGK